MCLLIDLCILSVEFFPPPRWGASLTLRTIPGAGESRVEAIIIVMKSYIKDGRVLKPFVSLCKKKKTTLR